MRFEERDRTSCPTHKVRYRSETEANENLTKILAVRLEQARDRPPERQAYLCEFCDGWHLSSRPPELEPPEPPKRDAESWEEYAHRLERRIKNQREHIKAINELRADAGNRAERKRVNRLTMALGNERLGNYRLSEMNRWLVSRVKELEEKENTDAKAGPDQAS